MGVTSLPHVEMLEPGHAPASSISTVIILVISYWNFFWNVTYLKAVRGQSQIFHRAFPQRDFLSPTQLKCTIILLWSVVSDSVTPWTVAHQAPLSIEFSRQDYWSGLPYPSPGGLPDPGSEPACLASPILAGRFLPAAPDIPRAEKSSYGVALFPLSVLSCLFSVLSTPKCSGLMPSNRSVSFIFFSPATPGAKISPAILRDFKNSFQKWGR